MKDKHFLTKLPLLFKDINTSMLKKICISEDRQQASFGNFHGVCLNANLHLGTCCHLAILR